VFFFFSSRRRHTRCLSDWSSDVCSSDLKRLENQLLELKRKCLFGDGRIGINSLANSWLHLGDAGCKMSGEGRKEACRTSSVALRSEERRVGKECGWRWARVEVWRVVDGR